MKAIVQQEERDAEALFWRFNFNDRLPW